MRALFRPAMIFVPILLGFLLPQAAALSFLVKYLLICMLYAVALQLNVRRMHLYRSHFALLGLNLLFGVAPYLLLLKFTGNRDLALAAFFIGITPTASAAPVVMGFLGGRVEYVVTAFLVNTFGVSLALIALLPLVCGNASWTFAGTVCGSVLSITLIPAALAAVTRTFFPHAAEWPQKHRNASFCCWSAMLFIIAAGASQFFCRHPETPKLIVFEIALCAVVLCALHFLAGYWIAPRRFRREASQSLGQKNTGFTIYLALTYANALAALGPICYILCHNTYNAIQMYQLDRRKAKENSHEADSCNS